MPAPAIGTADLPAICAELVAGDQVEAHCYQ